MAAFHHLFDLRFALDSEGAKPGCHTASYQASQSGIVKCWFDFSAHTKQSESVEEVQSLSQFST